MAQGKVIIMWRSRSTFLGVLCSGECSAFRIKTGTLTLAKINKQMWTDRQAGRQTGGRTDGQTNLIYSDKQ